MTIEGNLTIQVKVLVFKSLTIPKTVHLSLITTVPQAIIIQLQKKSKNKTFNTFKQLRGRRFEGR